MSSLADKTENTIRGTVLKVRFKDPKTDFAILLVKAGAIEFGAKGPIKSAEVGSEYDFMGSNLSPSKYGQEMIVEAFAPVFDASWATVLRNFLKRHVNQIGPTIAKRITDHFKEDEVEHVMLKQPERLLEIEGIGDDRMNELHASWVEHQEELQLLKGMTEARLNIGPIMTLLADLRELRAGRPAAEGQLTLVGEIAQTIASNPYRFYYDGTASFNACEDLFYYFAAQAAAGDETRMRLYADSALRHEAYVYRALRELRQRTSSTAHARVDLLNQVRKETMNRSRFAHQLDAEQCIQSAMSRPYAKLASHEFRFKDQYGNDERFTYYGLSSDIDAEYLLYRASQFALKERPMVDGNPMDFDVHFDRLVATYEQYDARCSEPAPFQLSKRQQAALIYMLSHPVCILLGPPGSGKSAILSRLCAFLRMIDQVPALMAPTGKAALRMIEATGVEAQTVHRALRLSPYDGSPTTDTPPAPIMVVDEASMLGSQMGGALAACLLGTDQTRVQRRLYLVGDIDQLPSVEPGNVLHDLVHNLGVPTVYLTEIFRQAEGSGISLAAQSIIYREEQDDYARKPMTRFPPGGDVEDVSLRLADYVEHIFDVALGMGLAGESAQERGRITSVEEFTRMMRNVLVLAPMYRGTYGVTSLNSEMLRVVELRYLRNRPPGMRVKIGGLQFGPGDRVMATVNDPTNRFVNGSLGSILSIDVESEVYQVQFDDGVTCDFDFGNGVLSPGYAISVHKAQGSQAALVAFSMSSEARNMLYWRLVYTAMTRASRRLILNAVDDLSLRDVHRGSQDERSTFLALFASFGDE